jgi:uncharacterized damage-inducible protein DinB
VPPVGSGTTKRPCTQSYQTDSLSGQRFGTRRSDVLLHVCTHAHYTAAQVINMLRQVGVEKLPETMLISLARHEVM